MAVEICDYEFEDPVLLGGEFAFPGEGVYAVLCPTESDRADCVKDEQGYAYRVICVEETAGADARLGPGHPLWKPVHDKCPSPYVAFLRMKGSNQVGRRAVLLVLVETYRPICNLI